MNLNFIGIEEVPGSCVLIHKLSFLKTFYIVLIGLFKKKKYNVYSTKRMFLLIAWINEGGGSVKLHKEEIVCLTDKI